jgi:hypothetical protein
MSDSLVQIDPVNAIVSALVGGITLWLLLKQIGEQSRQIHEQSKFNQRIADLEYIKLMEPKLLGIVYYDTNYKESLHSAPTFDWYKFQFLAGRVYMSSNGPDKIFLHLQLHKMNMISEAKTAYIKTFDDTIAHIGTPDLKKAFEASKWAEFYKVCKQ